MAEMISKQHLLEQMTRREKAANMKARNFSHIKKQCWP